MMPDGSINVKITALVGIVAISAAQVVPCPVDIRRGCGL
jgi:hypothetical protein